MQKSWNSKL